LIDLFAILDGREINPIRNQIIWNGHVEEDLKLGRTVDGRGLLSTSASGASIAWSTVANGSLKQNARLSFKKDCFCLTMLAGTLIGHIS
jgi:hypothetical protein